MKTLKFILVFTVTSTLFFCCGASKDKPMHKFQKNPPFKIVNAVVTNWVGGKPGVRGLKVAISIDNKNIKLDSLYFRNRKTALKLLANSNPSMYIGVFITSKGINDYILHKDVTKEFGNTPRLFQEKIPFNLKNNEAVVSYQFQTKNYFYKITNVKEVH